MPGGMSLAKQEYYAHPQNQFWKIMFSLFGSLPVPGKFEDRVALLLKNHIALWDVLESCEREGSLDIHIKNHIENNIPALLATHPSIHTIVFNGKESHKFFVRKFGKEIPLRHFVMPSTSPANTVGFEKKLSAWKEIATNSF